MKLYIQVDEQNNFINHPHFGSNLEQMYPNHDFESGPPEGWMEFIRVAPPEIGVYQKFDDNIGSNIANAFQHNGLEYKIVDGKYTDVWHVLDMTEEEIAEKQQVTKESFAEYPNYASWTFNEEKCTFEPPVEYPTDGNLYRWDEETTSWVEFVPEEP